MSFLLSCIMSREISVTRLSEGLFLERDSDGGGGGRKWKRNFNRLTFSVSKLFVRHDCHVYKYKDAFDDAKVTITGHGDVSVSVVAEFTCEDLKELMFCALRVEGDGATFPTLPQSCIKRFKLELREGDLSLNEKDSGFGMLADRDSEFLLRLTIDTQSLGILLRAITSGSLRVVHFNAIISSLSTEDENEFPAFGLRRHLLIDPFERWSRAALNHMQIEEASSQRESSVLLS